MKREKMVREWYKEVAKWKLEGGEAKSGKGVVGKHLKWLDFENGKFGGPSSPQKVPTTSNGVYLGLTSTLG